MTKATETGRVEPTAGEAIPRPEQTRARAGAREGEEIAIRSVRVPPGMRRTPLVLVEVERHGLRLTFAVAMLRGGEKVIRPPRGPDGTGGRCVAACAGPGPDRQCNSGSRRSQPTGTRGATARRLTARALRCSAI